MKKDEVKVISKLVDIPICDLHTQYVHNVTPIELWNYDMSVLTSPHVELLRYIKKHGLNWKGIWKLRYVAERKNRYKIGLTLWTDKHLRDHIIKRWEIYKSLKHRGYKPKLYRKKNGEERPVEILKKPFWETRFGFDAEWLHGLEVWDGMGRIASAIVLGWDTIPAVWVKDRYPGTKKKGRFEKKLNNVKGVWNVSN